LAVFPLFESSVAAPPLSVESLVRARRQHVGRIRLHEIEATLDTLDNPAFAAEVRDGPSAIVIPCFVASFDPEPLVGELGKYVQGRLNGVSPSDSANLSALLNSGRLDKGSVDDLALHIAPKSRAAFPFDHLFIVTLARESEHGTPDEGVFGNAVPRLMQMAAAKRIVALVVLAIGYNWANKHSISFDSIYEPLFNGLQSSSIPKTIVLDLYHDWPTFSIEHAVGAIHTGVDHFLLANPTTQFYRQEVRLLLLLVPLCLLATKRYVPLTLRSVAIIAPAYVVLCHGADMFVNLVATGLSGVGRTLVQVLVFGSLAFLFPKVVRWRADTLFPPETPP